MPVPTVVNAPAVGGAAIGGKALAAKGSAGAAAPPRPTSGVLWPHRK